ncbi:hypothetical protein PUN28_010986 [Cardiocondyla obscurior]|uniref:Secreted protein n=1 Tax=Cardiocondyla obscurior TaxID=286306 RepID=A0AAW2FM08_9HYME
MAVLVERRVCFARIDRAAIASCLSFFFFFSRDALNSGEREGYRCCNKQDYDPFRRAIVHGVYFEIYNVLLLPPVFTSGLTRRVFSRRTLAALKLFHSVPCLRFFLPCINIVKPAYEAKRVERIAKFRTACKRNVGSRRFNLNTKLMMARS